MSDERMAQRLREATDYPPHYPADALPWTDPAALHAAWALAEAEVTDLRARLTEGDAHRDGLLGALVRASVDPEEGP